MAIAKRTLVVSGAELRKLFGLPEEVEVLAVRANKGYEDGFEFLIVSAEEIEVDGQKITIEQRSDGAYRRLGLSSLRKEETINFNVTVNVDRLKSDTVQEVQKVLLDEISRGLNLKGTNLS